MLELALVKPTTASTDATQSTTRKSAVTEQDGADETDFETAYDAAENETTDGEPVAEDNGTGEVGQEGSENDSNSEQVENADSADTSPDEDLGFTDNLAQADSAEAPVDAQAEPMIGPASAPAKTQGAATEPDIPAEPARKAAETAGARKKTQNTGPDTPAEPQVRKPVAPSTLETVVTAKAAESEAKAQVLESRPNTLRATETTRPTGASAPTMETAERSTVGVERQAMIPAAEQSKLKREASIHEDIARREVQAANERTVAPAPVRTAGAAPVQPPFVVKQLTAHLSATEKGDSAKILTTDIEGLGPIENRPATASGPTTFGQVMARAETPGMIARQMAEAMQRLPDRPVEIALNPRELGRVRMNISAAETGITVSVLAERPETLDLMRRNIDQLSIEFEAIGYTNINFAFSEGETAGSFAEQQDTGNEEPTSFINLETIDEDTEHPPTLPTNTGVDIRL